MKINKTVFLYIDAFGYDLLKETRFLKELAEKNLSAKVKVEPLHQFEFSIFTSQPQKENNLWAWYYLNRKDSPYKWLRYLRPIFPILNKEAFRRTIDYANSLMMYLKGQTRFVRIAKIPLNKASYFSTTAKKSFIDINPTKTPTLFDILRKKGISYTAYEWPLKATNKKISMKLLKKKDNAILRFLSKQKSDFLFAHLTELDFIMHKYGKDSNEVKQYLKILDLNIKKFLLKFKQLYPNSNVIIASDHGMVNIKKYINVTNILKNEDCLYFSDATLIRIWTKDRESFQRIIKKSSKLKEGKTYTKFNIKKLGITYNRDYTGDIMWVANPGVLISPNYFDGYKRIKAMHGYTPTEELSALFILNPNKPRQLKMNLIDMTPTILTLLKIKKPISFKGKSII